MIRIAGVVCLFLSAFSETALARTCYFPSIRTLDNQTVNGTMWAFSGKRCSVSLGRSRGPIFSTRLIERPNHGSASVKGNRVIYLSRPGYVGEDRLVYARYGMDMINQPVTRTIILTVKVRPID
jgi:hypothetical protein